MSYSRHAAGAGREMESRGVGSPWLVGFHTLAWACVVALLALGCDSQPKVVTPTARPASTNVVARVGEVSITAQSVQAELQRRGGAMDKRQVLDELIRFQVLLAKARAAGYDRDPELQSAWERAVVAKFQEDQLSRRESAAAGVSEEEMHAYYERNLARHTAPARVRAGVIFLKSAAKAEPDAKLALARKADSLRDEATRAAAAAFAELVRVHSEDQATRYQGGDTGWVQTGVDSAHWEPEVIAAATGLSEPGEVGPVLATAKGFYIIRLIESRPATVTPFDQVRDTLRTQLTREKLKQLRQGFFEEIKTGLRIEINQVALDAIAAPVPSAEPRPPALPGG